MISSSGTKKIFRVHGDAKLSPDSIVISGGGAKGIMAVGVLKKLYDNNPQVFKKVDTFCGTSIGSVITLLMCLDFTLDEIYMILTAKLVPALIAGVMSITIATMKKNYGVVDVNVMFSILEDEIFDKSQSIPTLEEIHSLYGKDFICTGYNLSENKLEYFSRRTYPDMQCTEAVKISCLVPGLFQKHEYRGCYYIDGGISDNFPIEIVSSSNTLGINLCPQQKKKNTYIEYIESMIFIRTKKIKYGKKWVIECIDPAAFPSFEIRKDELQRFLFEGYSFNL
jgi:predicted acylesterase/phospholipase RssA